MKNTLKIIFSSLIFSLLSLSTVVFGVGIPDQSQPGQFNYEFNEALKYEWRIKIQEKSGMSLFDEARAKVQSVKTTPTGTKTTEAIHNMGNDFCRGFYGTCDETSLYARLVAGCVTARETAMKKMESTFVKNNTKLLLASYTSCYDLANDIILAYKDAASIEISRWNKEQIVQSQEIFTEKAQSSFQEKVSNTWDVFVKKFTNIVRGIQGFTETVFV